MSDEKVNTWVHGTGCRAHQNTVSRTVLEIQMSLDEMMLFLTMAGTMTDNNKRSKRRHRGNVADTLHTV